MVIGSIILGILLLCLYLFKKYQQKIGEFVIGLLEKSFTLYHSFGRIKLIMIGLAGIFIGLSIIAAGLIQDNMANEFKEFDTVISYLIGIASDGYWYHVMAFSRFLTSSPILAGVILMTMIWLFKKEKSGHWRSAF